MKVDKRIEKLGYTPDLDEEQRFFGFYSKEYSLFLSTLFTEDGNTYDIMISPKEYHGIPDFVDFKKNVTVGFIKKYDKLINE